MIVYILFRGLIFLVGLFPFWLLYLFSDFLYWLVYRIIGYRKAVVQSNLQKAFPTKTEAERLQIERKFYQHLFDILLESIKGFSMSKKNLLERQRLIGNMPQEMLDKHQSIVILGGHYGNWEWGGISASFHVNTDVIVLYSPIKNKKIDNYLKSFRESYQTYFWASSLAPRAFKKYQDNKAAFVMIADQSPSNPKRAHWLPFLHQETAFLKGPASYAKNYDLPVLYINIKRVKRGYYTMELEILTEKPSSMTTKELTFLFAQKLEQKIEETPELWLWSHRRWKHSLIKNDL